MDATTIGVDLAKNVFELVVADSAGQIKAHHRLTRARFMGFFANRPCCRVVMEACGSAHHFARALSALGYEVRLLPAQYVRAYVRRNKTDRADATALIEAARCADIHPVPIKSMDQQAIQHLHRLRTQWMRARTSRINFVRAMLREFGVAIPLGATRAIAHVRLELAASEPSIPTALHPALAELLAEITQLQQRCEDIDRQLRTLTQEDPIVQQLLEIPGVGPLTATAMRSALVDVQRFPSGRHLASWLGLTAREHSSGERRRLGRISKQGDPYLRTLLVHGARAVLIAAQAAKRRGQKLDRLRTWALDTLERCGHNKAAVALANKLARIIWATWKHARVFNANWAAQSA
jgi:transposase